MSDAEVIKTRYYKIKPSSPVYLTVTIGNENVGGSIVKLMKKEICEGEVINQMIGADGENLYDKILHCDTTVEHKNFSTKITTVNYNLSGGEETKDFPFLYKVKNNGDKVLFLISFVFE